MHQNPWRMVQQSRLEKEGVVGLFNRVYFPISTAIDEFLQGVYEPTADTSGRYDFIPGEGSAGVVIYDDKFSYSHHATDPAGGKLCNAFDLVRLHKFSEDDDKKSYKQMCEFAMTLDKVKLQDLEEKKQRAADDFSENTNWQTKLRYMPRSKCLENSVWNLMLILNNDPDFANIAFNELVGRVQITGAIPWTRPSDNKFWRDADTAQLKALIDIRYETFSSRNHDVAFTKVVEDRHFNPLRDWIDALPEWDGVVRLENLYIDFLGANNTGYVKAATRKSFVAAVARIYEPGTKFDSVVVLVGPQGCGKSTIFAKMGNEYYSDSLNLTDMKDKSGAHPLCFQHIGTVQSHADVFHMHTHPAFAFMQNGTFHISNILLYLFAAASGCYTLHACGPTLTKKSRPKAARKPRWGFQCFTNRKLLSGLFGGLLGGILDHSSLGFNSTSLVDGLCIGQNVTGLLLDLADGLHGGVLHAQHGSSGLGVDLLGILAGQQLETGRAEQRTGGEQCDLLDIHSNFPTFSISCQRPCTAGPIR